MRKADSWLCTDRLEVIIQKRSRHNVVHRVRDAIKLGFSSIAADFAVLGRLDSFLQHTTMIRANFWRALPTDRSSARSFLASFFLLFRFRFEFGEERKTVSEA